MKACAVCIVEYNENNDIPNTGVGLESSLYALYRSYYSFHYVQDDCHPIRLSTYSMLRLNT